jgi:hypothetical protein
MNNLTRRDFVRGSGLGIALLAASSYTSFAAEGKRRVVVIGSGWGGARRPEAKSMRMPPSAAQRSVLNVRRATALRGTGMLSTAIRHYAGNR